MKEYKLRRDNIVEPIAQTVIHEAKPSSVVLFYQLAPVIGLFLMLASLFLFVSLASWHVDDPSWSFASSHEVKNLMGRWGANFSDILMQFLGLSSVCVIIPPFFWAIRLMRSFAITHFWRRFISYIFTILIFACFFSLIYCPKSWSLATRLGGVVGDIEAKAVLNLLNLAITGTNFWWVFYIVIGIIFIFGLFFLLYSSALIFTHSTHLKEILDAKTIELQEQLRAKNRELKAQRQAQNKELDQNGGYGQIPKDILVDEQDMERFYKQEHDLDVIVPSTLKTAPDEDILPNLNPPQDSYESQNLAKKPSVFSKIRGFFRPNKKQEPQFKHNLTTQLDIVKKSFGNKIEPAFSGYSLEQEGTQDLYGIVDPNFANNQDYLVSQNYNEQSASDPYPDQNALMPQNSAIKKVKKTRSLRSRVLGRQEEAQAALQHSMVENNKLKRVFELPFLSLLNSVQKKHARELFNEAQLRHNAAKLEEVLEEFSVKGRIIQVRPGPVVTLYELEPAPGVKSSRVIGLADDIARSMSALSVRVAVVPGRNAIGIELPNKERQIVYLKTVLESQNFRDSKAKLALALGEDIAGEPVVTDLAKMPHLLVAGTTGSGKSVGINTMILSLLYKMTPEQCRFIMVDPKMLELSVYEGIPHLLTPVVTDPQKAVVALKWAVREMEDRYRKMAKMGVRNIDGYNERIEQMIAKGESFTQNVQIGFDPQTGKPIFEERELDKKKLPYIVIIIDEMADLMMVAGKDIEGAVQRLAQMARAAGLHVIMATQRPSVDVITGTIKANFPTRISFSVTSKIDSRTILGEQGAEQLLGQGDMLFMMGGGKLRRVHGPFVSDSEVEEVVKHLKTQGEPEYLQDVMSEPEEDDDLSASQNAFSNSKDDLYNQAINIIMRDKKVSTSYIQRRLSIGYNKAATLIERMEEEGVISKPNTAGKREILLEM